MHKSNKIQLARQLRRNQSEAEEKLWLNIWKRSLNNVKFRRQQPIGSYIVDFVSFENKLIIEIDGGQHYAEKAVREDRFRDEYMRDQGLKVLRRSDREVFENLDGIVEKIYKNL